MMSMGIKLLLIAVSGVQALRTLVKDDNFDKCELQYLVVGDMYGDGTPADKPPLMTDAFMKVFDEHLEMILKQHNKQTPTTIKLMRQKVKTIAAKVTGSGAQAFTKELRSEIHDVFGDLTPAMCVLSVYKNCIVKDESRSKTCLKPEFFKNSWNMKKSVKCWEGCIGANGQLRIDNVKGKKMKRINNHRAFIASYTMGGATVKHMAYSEVPEKYSEVPEKAREPEAETESALPEEASEPESALPEEASEPESALPEAETDSTVSEETSE